MIDSSHNHPRRNYGKFAFLGGRVVRRMDSSGSSGEKGRVGGCSVQVYGVESSSSPDINSTKLSII
jgi:hypothetical protein